MQSSKTIKPPVWMISESVRLIYQALNTHKDPQALFVGGVVRDALLQQAGGDIDMATIHHPDEVIARLEAAGVKVLPTGIEHGTVTALHQGQRVEITTLRRDVSTDGRRAVVAFTQDWREDAGRRDFTINTLLADIHGRIYDPLGCAVSDLEQGSIVFVGDAATRIAEDYLRILRFFRFYGRYGRGAPDAQAVAACEAASSHLQELSRERVTQEMIKIIEADNAPDIIELMDQHHILQGIKSPDFSPALFRHFCSAQNFHDKKEPAARLALLLAFDLSVAENNWALSNAQKKFIRTFDIARQKLDSIASADIHQSIYDYGNVVTIQALLYGQALGLQDDEATTQAIKYAANWVVPVFPLTGEDVLALGVKPGPPLGKLLAEVESWWRASDFVPGRAACLARLAELTQQ